MGRERKSNKNNEIRVALCGNPNVGKSTLFNSLSGKHRHTGNWSGKTVDVMPARVKGKNSDFIFYDIPGTYSLISHSKEEEIAVGFLSEGNIDVCVYVCDATAILRSLPLLLQIKEAFGECIICLNLLSDAEKHNIEIDKDKLSRLTSCPVLEVDAKKKSSARSLLSYLEKYKKQINTYEKIIDYPPEIERSASAISNVLDGVYSGGVSNYFLALRLLEGNFDYLADSFSKINQKEVGRVHKTVLDEQKRLYEIGITPEKLSDEIVMSVIEKSEYVGKEVLTEEKEGSRYGRGILDKIICGKFTAYPVMAVFLALCFFITLYVASYPSSWLDTLFTYLNGLIRSLLVRLSVNGILISALCDGILGTLFTVVAVMLPPMAIFFPMFSILEEAGVLPRIAYNLDRPFASSGACGKQALTMCMGIGCNAVGVSEARIIDSERERILAILTNSFVPCNGRFPILASVGAVFVCQTFGDEKPALVALFVTVAVLVGIFMTFPATLILSKTILRGEKSSFTIELPPFRRVALLKVIYRSLKTKVLSVLWRAVAVAVPMGLVLFLLSYISVGEESLLVYLSSLLNPVALWIGLDGVILLSFFLALPASEMVIPLMVSIYSITSGTFGLPLAELLALNSFTPIRAVCTALFCLFHFPCSTTLITVYKETKSLKYTLISIALPTAFGITLCFLVNIIAKLFI